MGVVGVGVVGVGVVVVVVVVVVASAAGGLAIPSLQDCRQGSGGPPDLAQRKPRLEVPVSSEFW